MNYNREQLCIYACITCYKICAGIYVIGIISEVIYGCLSSALGQMTKGGT